MHAGAFAQLHTILVTISFLVFFFIANSARVRLVRLTEAAENLKKRAATSVRMGKENEAVDLLVQKKKLTKALENIKERIEVLDRLSAKISEVMTWFL